MDCWIRKIFKKKKIDFFTAAYSKDLVDRVNKFVPAYKIGSGDITDHEIIAAIAKKKKPVFMATGAANSKEVDLAVKKVKKYNRNLCLMQCNTNYTGERINFKYLNLNVLEEYRKKYKVITGLSDHTPGDLSVIAAVALGARVIEKHFTDDNSREGPDHYFSMNPLTWKKMVDKVRDVESMLGDGRKKIEINEKKTFILQRRAVMLNKDMDKGTKIKKNDLVFLRPNIKNGFQPYNYDRLIGKKLTKVKHKYEAILKKDIKWKKKF